MRDNDRGGIVQYRGCEDVTGMHYRGVGRPYRYYLLVYQLMPSIEIQAHEMLFALRFDLLELLDCLRGFLYERTYRARGQLHVSDVFSGAGVHDS
jgi:hypothetical protein